MEDQIISQDIAIVESQRPRRLPLDLQAEVHLPSDVLRQADAASTLLCSLPQVAKTTGCHLRQHLEHEFHHYKRWTSLLPHH